MIEFAKLSAPFSPTLISWRVGSTNRDKAKGMALAYLDARDVMERLDEVCGPAGWQCRYSHAASKTICDIGILCGNEWLWKADGAGDSDIEAEKGALSDAFKRAGVRWGIGRYLYNLKSPWVTIEPYGKSYIISDSEYPKLVKVLQDHFDRWQAAHDPKTAGAVNAEKLGRKEAGEDWAAWAKGDAGREWCRRAVNEIGLFVNAADLNAWLRGNTKFTNALYDHAPDRHTWLMDKKKAKLEELTAKAS
jgi:hypothetical protein